MKYILLRKFEFYFIFANKGDRRERQQETKKRFKRLKKCIGSKLNNSLHFVSKEEVFGELHPIRVQEYTLQEFLKNRDFAIEKERVYFKLDGECSDPQEQRGTPCFHDL